MTDVGGDRTDGVEAFINSFPGASLAAMRRGFLELGVEDNDVLAFPELMDSESLFLTANCDTLYYISFPGPDQWPDRRRIAGVGCADGNPGRSR